MIQSNGEHIPISSFPIEVSGSFDWQPQTRVIFGPDTLDQLGDLARELGSRRPLVVTDPGIEEAGHTERAMQSLLRAA